MSLSLKGLSSVVIGKKSFYQASLLLNTSYWGYSIYRPEKLYIEEWRALKLTCDEFIAWLNGSCYFMPGSVKRAYVDSEDEFIEYLQGLISCGVVVSNDELGNWLARYLSHTIAHENFGIFLSFIAKKDKEIGFSKKMFRGNYGHVQFHIY
jgi:hypothetical protein